MGLGCDGYRHRDPVFLLWIGATLNRFETCLAFVLEREGGYVCHPNDKGGPTNCGITQTVCDELFSSKKLPKMNVRDLTKEQISDIYLNLYWLPTCANYMPAPLDIVVFDSAVNHGVKQSIRFLQHTLDLTDIDGICGAKTLKAVKENADKARAIAITIINRRSQFYDNIVRRDPSQDVFLAGWKNRLKHLMQECK